MLHEALNKCRVSNFHGMMEQLASVLRREALAGSNNHTQTRSMRGARSLLRGGMERTESLTFASASGTGSRLSEYRAYKFSILAKDRFYRIDSLRPRLCALASPRCAIGTPIPRPNRRPKTCPCLLLDTGEGGGQPRAFSAPSRSVFPPARSSVCHCWPPVPWGSWHTHNKNMEAGSEGSWIATDLEWSPPNSRGARKPGTIC